MNDRYLRDLLAEIRRLNVTMKDIKKALNRIAPPDTDPFDPDDDYGVTEDDLPFVVPGQHEDDE